MKINALNLALASSGTTAAVWIFCSLLVWILPGPMMNMTGHMVHMDMNRLGWMLSPSGFIWGLVVWSIFAGIFAWILATIYNLLSKSVND